MEKFIGVKLVDAKPMTRKEYNDYRGWELPSDENGEDAGFLKDDGNGHIQWDPLYAFERDFRPCDTMTFGLAIEAMKMGHKVARKGWNGKGMWLWLCAVTGDWTSEDGEIYGRLPYVYMKTADNKVVPWLASQTDVLAEDWQMVEV